MKLLVYGTLKKGYYNHDTFLSTAKYLGERKVHGYTLYSLGSYPTAVKEKDSYINGELYEVDNNTMHSILWMERGAGYDIEIVDDDIILFYYHKEDLEKISHKEKIGATWNEDVVHFGLSSES